ncbi:hypothetical protein HPC38_01010 [Pasteurellaceae bacterium HPA106]|nr:hypothetical protein [Spirabiliibacterium pneumoniae]
MKKQQSTVLESSAVEVESAVAEDQSAVSEVEAVGVSVLLKAIHPQESYGRAGYRFNKQSTVEIALDQLSARDIEALTQDPWLTVEFITKE